VSADTSKDDEKTASWFFGSKKKGKGKRALRSASDADADTDGAETAVDSTDTGNEQAALSLVEPGSATTMGHQMDQEVIRSSGRRLDATFDKQDAAFYNHYMSHHTALQRNNRLGLGIGGFSLRSAKMMFRIATEYATYSNDTEPESLFFSRMGLALGYSVADRATSLAFAWESECSDLVRDFSEAQNLPVALQASWAHGNLSVVNMLVNNNFLMTDKSLTALPKGYSETVKVLKALPLIAMGNYPSSTYGASALTEQEIAVRNQGAVAPNQPAAAAPPTAPAKAAAEPPATDRKKVPANEVLAALGGSAQEPAQPQAPSSTVNYAAAWEALRNPKVVSSESKMEKLLDELGVLSEDDLKHCDEEIISKLLTAVKPVQKKRIAKLLGSTSV
jgi:hypothetical protein